MMRETPLVCRYCGSTDVKMNGRALKKDFDYQIYFCHGCRRRSYIRMPKREAQLTLALPIPPATPNNFTWAAYNEAQTREKLLFLDLLEDLCSRLPEEPGGKVGRPNASNKDMVFCMAAKLYEGLSSRRVSSDLNIALQRGHIGHVPHFNTILKYFNNPAMAPFLTALIRLSALPLKDLETTFAVDASGLSSAFYSRWFDYRFGHLDGRESKIHDWIKIHVICGVKTNIVTAITVTEGKASDFPQFPDLVKKTAEHFNVQEVCADKGYLSRKNVEVVMEIGATPYIPFKTNTTGKADGSLAWKKMFHYYQLHHEEFMARYHQRSNVEGTFSMLKRKFSTKLMTKNEVAQMNEALAMVLCHNICVLVREAIENGVSTEFKESAHLFPALHINPRACERSV